MPLPLGFKVNTNRRLGGKVLTSKEGTLLSWTRDRAPKIKTSSHRRGVKSMYQRETWDSPMREGEFKAPHATSRIPATISVGGQHGIGMYKIPLVMSQQNLPGQLFKAKMTRSRARKVGRPELAGTGLFG